ncbi:DUF1801 domain-containing protein [bacterium]|nr:DUF1801 domain-containing protein [bacterium]
MFKPINAKTNEEYFAQLPIERRAPMAFIDQFIKENAPGLKPEFGYNMPGYGSFKYKNYKKEIINWPVVSIASQKNYISIYICAVEGKEYIAEKYKKELGKVNVGKSCIRFKNVEDLNLDTLKTVLKLAEKFPGLIQNEKNG